MKLKVGYFGIGRLTFDTRLAEKNFPLISNKINLKYKNSIGIEINNPGHEFKYKKYSLKQISSLIKLLKVLKKK